MLGVKDLTFFIINKALICIIFDGKRFPRTINIKKCMQEASFVSLAGSLGNNMQENRSGVPNCLDKVRMIFVAGEEKISIIPRS